jgi:tetratricopeptide (TPR) repeat protein
MKRTALYFLLCLLCAILLIACSTSKNTWLSRKGVAFTTYYNIYFNANESFKEGISNINKAQKDNYSELLTMYPISVHNNARAGVSNMDITIEKCRKAIKTRSIKVKPAKNYSKTKDPKYISFMNQEEYNPMVGQSWLLLASAEFHKADFMGALGTYSYIINHFRWDTDIVNECRIGIARCYRETGWLYEAEDALNKVDRKLSDSHINGLWAATNADLLIQEKKYAEAVPFLKIAIQREGSGFLKTRFRFILGQLSVMLGDKATAFDAFSKVVSSSPPYQMEFAARLQRAQVAGNQTSKTIKEVEQMARSPKNKDYLSAIYLTLGNIYLGENKKDKAVENYNKAVAQKNGSPFDIMEASIKLGDLYYADKAYLNAQPHFAKAAQLIKNDHPDFGRVTRMADVLNDLGRNNSIVNLQDSLQSIARLSETERNKVIDQIIARTIKEEQQAAREQADAQRHQAINNNGSDGFLSMGGVQQTNTAASNGAWYFYNPAAVASGEEQFEHQWGRRTLEDDWRRSNKNGQGSPVQSAAQQNTASTGVKDQAQPNQPADKHKPDYYLAQLPLTPEAIQKSNLQIGNALLNMGKIYENRLEDIPMAIRVYDELAARFKPDSLWLDAYFSLYKLNTKTGSNAEAVKYKTMIADNFPNSKYAEVLKYPDYALAQQQFRAKQDSLYEATFLAYTKGDFSTVMNNYRSAAAAYPLSDLIPRFALLNALALGKTGSQEAMKTELDNILAKYPQSPVNSTVKDLLALLGQGKTVTKGTSYGTLFSSRTTVPSQANGSSADNTGNQTDTAKPEFDASLSSRYLLVLPLPVDTIDANNIQYKLASFNFKHFVLQDYDLEVRKPTNHFKFIIVSEFATFADARHYRNLIMEDQTVAPILQAKEIRPVPVSDTNLKQLLTQADLENYLTFYQNTLIPAQTIEDKKTDNQ